MYKYKIVTIGAKQDGYCLDFNSSIAETIFTYAGNGWRYVDKIPARVLYTTDSKCGSVLSYDLIFEKEE